MAWTYLAASEDSPSPWIPGCDPSPTAKLSAGLRLACYLAWLRSSCLWPRSGTTCEPSTPKFLMGSRSTSFTVASPARTLALQAVAQAWTAIEAVYFSRSFAFSRSWPPPLSSLKTSRLSGPVAEREWGKSWPASGTIVGGILFPLRTLALPTSETAGSCWLPTPSASRYGTSNNGDPGDGRRAYATKGKLSLDSMAAKGLWPTPQARDFRSGDAPDSPRLARKMEQGWSLNLNDAVKLWPTPTLHGNYSSPKEGTKRGLGLSTAAKNWPTPRASDGEKGGPNQRGSKGDFNLPAAVHHWPTPNATDWKGPSTRSPGKERPLCDDDLPTRAGGQLNPNWVEWLMGYPLGWTVLEDWATQWYRPKRAKPSSSSRGSHG